MLRAKLCPEGGGGCGGAEARSCNPAKNRLACSVWAKERAGVKTSCGIKKYLQYNNTSMVVKNSSYKRKERTFQEV